MLPCQSTDSSRLHVVVSLYGCTEHADDVAELYAYAMMRVIIPVKEEYLSSSTDVNNHLQV